ncbi:hypothetical protein [Nocardia sp. NPDC056100]|uniref:hypothetical protein n=1 Tax=Nocardia sp. NPDC056100 TaxID=3345712 RepID=UPI0035DA32F4
MAVHAAGQILDHAGKTVIAEPETHIADAPAEALADQFQRRDIGMALILDERPAFEDRPKRLGLLRILAGIALLALGQIAWLAATVVRIMIG